MMHSFRQRAIFVPIALLAVCLFVQPRQADAMRFHLYRGLLGRQRCGACLFAVKQPARPDVPCCAAVATEAVASKRAPRLFDILRQGLGTALETQREVYEGTIRLEKLAAEQPGWNLETEIRELIVKERRVEAEVDKLIAVLSADPNVVGFPEALKEIREDAQLVSKRLSQGKIGGEITRTIQGDIINALDEMLSIFRRKSKTATATSAGMQ